MYPATLEVIAKCQLKNDRKKVVIDTYAAGITFNPSTTYTIDLEQDFVKETEGSKFSNPAVTGLGTFTTNSTGPQVQTDLPSGSSVTNNTFIRYTYDRQILAGTSGTYKLFKDTASPQTINVTVTASGGYFYVDGVQQATLNLYETNTYVFTYPSAHPFALSTTADGTHGGGTEYTTGVTRNTSANTLTFVVPQSGPDLFYYCTSHSNMGGTANTGIEDSLLRTYDPSDSTDLNLTISSNQITLVTTGLIDAGETYYVLIDQGAVKDKDGLAAFGFDNDQEHRWTTAPSTNVDFPDLSATITGAFSPVATLNYAVANFVSQMANSFQMSADVTAINPVSANLTASFTQTSNIERTRGIVPLTLTNNITITSKSDVFYDSFNQTFTATAGVNCKTGFTISLESTYTSDLGIASTHRYYDTAVVDADSNTEILALGIQGFGNNTEVHIKENNSTTISGAVSDNQFNDDFGWVIDMAKRSNTNRDDVRLVIGSPRWDYTDTSTSTTYQSMGRVIVKELDRQGGLPYVWNDVNNIQRTAQGDYADDIEFGKEVAISNDSEWVAVVQQLPGGQSSPESQLHFYKRSSSGFYSDATRYTISSTSSPLNVSNGFNNARPSFNKGTGSMCVVNFDGDCLVIDADYTNSNVTIDQTISLSSDIECAAISGDKRFIAMGQPNHNSQQGQVTIYKLNSLGTSYVSHSVITPSGLNQYTYFGNDIQLSEQGDVMFVSAPGDNFAGSEQGKVYVYVRNSTSSNGWDLKQTLTQSQSNDEFGRRISLSGNFKYFSAVQPYYDQYDGKAYFYHIDDA